MFSLKQDIQSILNRAGHRSLDPKVLAAFEQVPRHKFVSTQHQVLAYEDHPLPIGYGQTISQPSLVAAMTALLELSSMSKVLEIGTGSGYQAAILSLLAKQVISLEVVAPLADSARQRLAELGYTNVSVVEGDGNCGYASEAPYDAIIVTAAATAIPQALRNQLKVGGRLLIPVGLRHSTQDLCLLTRLNDDHDKLEKLLRVSFVPFTKTAEQEDSQEF